MRRGSLLQTCCCVGAHFLISMRSNAWISFCLEFVSKLGCGEQVRARLAKLEEHSVLVPRLDQLKVLDRCYGNAPVEVQAVRGQVLVPAGRLVLQHQHVAGGA